MPLRAPIGISDFVLLREQQAYYVDKTDFITRVLQSPSEAHQFPRPRRFGKTLNLATLRTFLEKSTTDRSPLFQDLKVWQSQTTREHFQRYPVIYLTFKDVKARTWEGMFESIRILIAEELTRHRYLLDTGLDADTFDSFRRMLRREAAASECGGILRTLSAALAAYHRERVVILIDEYDLPIQTSFAEDYYDDAIAFFRNLLSSGLKDNPHLFKGVLTGVLRVAKESIFSGLNNVDVHSILGDQFATDFGFTQQEVDKLAQDMGEPDVATELKTWYDGYRFSGHTIYNPWSVMVYSSRRSEGFRPHWVFTGADDVLRHLVLEKGLAETSEVEALLRGEAVSRVVTEHIVLRDIDTKPDAVWNLLFLSGYLTARKAELVDGRIHADLAIPNREVHIAFEDSVASWMQASLGGSLSAVEALTRAMFRGEEHEFGKRLSQLVVRSMSHHDLGGKEPERVYQAFLLGLFVHLKDKWHVRSNRESGYGRYDVALIPVQPGQPGVVLELKSLEEEDGETKELALESALKQIKDRNYVEELKAAGASPIQVYGIVFDGKRVWVKKGE